MALAKVKKRSDQIVEAIADGMYHRSMKEKMTRHEARKAELTSLPADTPQNEPDLLPAASVTHAREVAELTMALNHPTDRQEAAEALRMLVANITQTPGSEQGEIFATLHRDLRTILE